VELEYHENNERTTQTDTDVGGWLGAGMYYKIFPRFILGFDVRYSHGEVLLFDKERAAGGLSSGFTVGFQF
jgi:hypothetical protein